MVTVPLVIKVDNQDEELQSIMTILKSLKKERQQRGHFLSNCISSLLKTELLFFLDHSIELASEKEASSCALPLEI